MTITSSQGLTARDFHHQSFVNPLDVFPIKSRLGSRSDGYRSPVRSGSSTRSASKFATASHKFACCGEDDGDSSRPSSAFDRSVGYDATTDNFSELLANPRWEEPMMHNSPSAMECEDCIDDCEDCEDEHQEYNRQKSVEREDFREDCEECVEEHEEVCLQGGQICSNEECDFSCFDCIDWNEFDRDKSLGLSFSVPLLGDNTFASSELPIEDNEMLDFQTPELDTSPDSLMAPPIEVPMHHQCLANTVPYWNGIDQTQLCTGTPGMEGQYPLPTFQLAYGCHPAAAHQQFSLPDFPASGSDGISALTKIKSMLSTPSPPTDPGPLGSTDDLLVAVSASNTSRSCQWVMPCGTVCGASFATTTNLKKHIKSIHLQKGIVKCSWQDCTSAGFASEAALTGHISKKHLAPLLGSSSNATGVKIEGSISSATSTSLHEGPFKCTFPGCPKSFMYKQVRDEHVASSHEGNKIKCPVCDQYLNGEGSNFKRHMATHRPKHQHMLCKYHGLGCKRRFPRLDNLRRHEACCKIGKKAGLIGSEHAHHHHHHHKHLAAQKV